MKKIIVVILGIALLGATGCATHSNTKPEVDEKYKLHGIVSWYELMTTDVEAAKKFYAELFGWTTKEDSTAGTPYTLIMAHGKEMGGIMTMPPEAKGAPPNWGVYVTVDDVDSTAEKAEKLGARILVAPRDIPDIGRFCVIQDPQGAVISAISYIQM